MQKCLGVGAFMATKAWPVSVRTQWKATDRFIHHLRSLVTLFFCQAPHPSISLSVCCSDKVSADKLGPVPLRFHLFCLFLEISIKVANSRSVLRWGRCWPLVSLCCTGVTTPSTSGGMTAHFIPQCWGLKPVGKLPQYIWKGAVWQKAIWAAWLRSWGQGSAEAYKRWDSWGHAGSQAAWWGTGLVPAR